MKKLFIISALIIGINSFAQEKKDDIITYKSDTLTIMNTDKGILTLYGNAALKTSVFEFINADKIVINTITKEVIVSGNYTIKTHGGTIQSAGYTEKNILKYKIGENIVYVE